MFIENIVTDKRKTNLYRKVSKINYAKNHYKYFFILQHILQNNTYNFTHTSI